jgi:RNA polymerase sigma-B factor
VSRARARTDTMTDVMLPALDLEAAHRLYAEAHDPDLEAELMRRHGPLARELAKRFSYRADLPDDACQVAMVALLRALRTFDPARGARFSTYAVPTILGTLKRHVRDRGWLVRPPRYLQECYLAAHAAIEELQGQLRRPPTVQEVAQCTGFDVGDVVEALQAGSGRRALGVDASSERSVQRAVEAAASDRGGQASGVEDRVFAHELLRGLPELEREVVVLTFFFEMTQKQIAMRLGTSQSTVSRLRRQALGRLRALACSNARSVTPEGPAGGRWADARGSPQSPVSVHVSWREAPAGSRVTATLQPALRLTRASSDEHDLLLRGRGIRLGTSDPT